MSLKFILGFVLLVVGVMVFGYGLNASQSLIEQVSNMFLGRFVCYRTDFSLACYVPSYFADLIEGGPG